MFKKKTLVVSYTYSFDYSKEPVELNELMFKEVPVNKKWGKYILLNSEDQARFGLSVIKKDFEKVLKKGCYYIVFFECHSAKNVFKASRLFNKEFDVRGTLGEYVEDGDVEVKEV